MSEVDEPKFDYTYVPEHLKEKVKNCKDLSFSERFDLVAELSGVGEDWRCPRSE